MAMGCSQTSWVKVIKSVFRKEPVGQEVTGKLQEFSTEEKWKIENEKWAVGRLGKICGASRKVFPGVYTIVREP